MGVTDNTGEMQEEMELGQPADGEWIWPTVKRQIEDVVADSRYTVPQEWREQYER